MSNEVADSEAWPPAGVRGVNLDTVIEIVRRRPEVTRSELIRLSGLSKATVSGIVGELLDHNFVVETGRLSAGRGRRHVLLSFNPGARLVLGAQVGDDGCTVVLTDLEAAVQHRTTRPIHGPDPELIFDAVADAANELRAEVASPVLGAGIGVPGDVDRSGRTVTVDVSHGWKDLPIAERLEARLGIPVVAANRAKVAALGHLRREDRQRVDNLVYVFLGRGIVAGMVVDGRLYFGRDGAAGDIGHVTVRRDGVLCACGNHGCLHTLAAEDAILRLARAAARRPESSGLLGELTNGRLSDLSLPIVAAAAARDDPDTRAVLAEVGSDIGVVVANLVTTLSPDVVVLGGPSVRLGEQLLGPIRDELAQRTLPEVYASLEIAESFDDGETGAAGAAALYLSQLRSVLNHY
jgi:predicted NBD/HSP70 family sugar kinase